MKSTFKLLVLGVGVMLASCSQNRYIVAPPFTDVSKISALKKGMSLNDVNNTLGIAPYDMYVSDEGYSIFTYNYRLKKRRIPVDNNESFMDRPGDPANKTINSEEAQKFGTDYYEEEKSVYISFKDDKLHSVISNDGLQKASQIMAITGSLSAIKNDPQFKVLPDELLKNNVVVPLDDKGNYIPNGDGGSGGVAPGYPGIFYMGSGLGVSAIPATKPREIQNSTRVKKGRVQFLPNLKRRNKGSEVNYEGDL